MSGDVKEANRKNEPERENKPKYKKSQKAEKPFDFERAAYVAFILVAVVCILAMIICLVSLVYNNCVFRSDYKITIDTIKETAEQIANNQPIQTDDSITPSKNAESTNTDSVDNLITHMESMIAIQKNGMTNDLMSFVYGILSTILVGACAGFVAKSRNNADEAQKKVQMAKKAAVQARNDALNASKAANGAINSAQEAEENANRISNLYDKMQGALLTNTVKIIRIHNMIALIEVALEEIVLLDRDQSKANNRVFGIAKEVKTLFDTKDLDYNSFDRESVLKLYDELRRLKHTVNTFIDESKKKYGSSENERDKGKLVSLQQSAENYHEWIDEAIQACERVAKPNT